MKKKGKTNHLLSLVLLVERDTVSSCYHN